MMNYMEMMRQQEPGRLALVEDGTPYTYGQLVELACHRSCDNVFFASAPKRGAVHLIQREKISDQLIEFLAANERGEIPVMVPGDAKVIPNIDESPENVGQNTETYTMCPQNGTNKREICMGVMTSGSTGEPKLLFRTYESWASFFPIQNRIFGIQPDSRLLAQGSLAFTGNLNLYLAQFSVGAAVIAQNRFQPRQWEQMITENKVDTVYLIPSKLMCMPRVMHGVHTSVKTILAGSQSLGREDALRLKQIFPSARIILYYGASELNYITYVTDASMTEQTDLIGKPFPGVQVEVRDTEIYVTTPYHVEGVVCPYTLSDCGYLDEKGDLHFTGRSDDIVSLRGRKVSTLRIEEILCREPEVDAAAVLALPESWKQNRYSEHQHMILTAFITKTGLAEPEEPLRRRIRRQLAGYEMPDRILEVDEMPRKENGKLDKRRLREQWMKQHTCGEKY